MPETAPNAIFVLLCVKYGALSFGEEDRASLKCKVVCGGGARTPRFYFENFESSSCLSSLVRVLYETPILRG
jgi:hypothetical protein